MAHVASSSVAPNAATVSLTVPGGASAGDVGVIQVGMSDTYSATLPSGWTTVIADTVGNLRYYVLIKTLVSGDLGSTINISVGASQKAFGSITVVSAVSDVPESFPAPTEANVDSTTRAVPSSSIAGARQVLTGVFGRGNSSPTTWTAPAGFTRTTQAFGTGTGACDGAVGYADIGSAGSVGGGNWVSDVSDLRGVAWLMVLAPAAVQLATPVIDVTISNPSVAGASDGEIEIVWDSVPFADHYLVERASGLDATTGWTTVADDVTATTYTITSLPSGNYSVGVTAMPGA